MCGRIVRSSPAEVLRTEFGAEPPADLTARWNVCPGDDVLAVVAGEAGRRMGWLRWGLVPPFARDPKEGHRCINARAESVATRPAFRAAFRRRRCLVVADGFYEWRREGRVKTPFFVRLRSGRPMAFAGLWERWRPPDDPDGPGLVSCAVVTCAANGIVAPIHDRMPVVLDPGARTAWLDPATDDPAALLVPAPDDALEAWPVSPRVNRPANDDAALIAAVG
jgi:putative SOS response-associated peptidase YedK